MEVFGHFVFPRFSGFFWLTHLFIGFFGLFYLLFFLDILLSAPYSGCFLEAKIQKLIFSL